MTDLPRCRLCKCTPIRLIDGSVKHDELASQCSLRLSVLTGAEWAALMGDQIQAIANRVCRDIPDEFHIEMVLENGAGWVSLFHKGKPVEIDMADWSIAEQFDVAMQCVQQILGEQQ
jgi:hypothetical protein